MRLRDPVLNMQIKSYTANWKVTECRTTRQHV